MENLHKTILYMLSIEHYFGGGGDKTQLIALNIREFQVFDEPIKFRVSLCTYLIQYVCMYATFRSSTRFIGTIPLSPRDRGYLFQLRHQYLISRISQRILRPNNYKRSCYYASVINLAQNKGVYFQCVDILL